jgi:hydroxycarboxylate dehydrogenase B
MPTISAQRLAEVATAIFEAAGATTENAEGVVSSLVDANLAGHDSHGVIRIPFYVSEIREGRLDPKATPAVVHETTTTAVVDGVSTFGQVGARLAADLAIRKAREAGLAAVAAMHCHHTGRIGEWAERVAAAGMVGMAAGAGPHGPYSVAPHGGAGGALGTNPIAWALPRAEGRAPILLDYATSAVAQGKLQVARAKGEPVPDGCILDSNGRPTNDVEEFFAGGLLLPFAGHKGYALSVVVELLAVGLSGGDQVPAGQRASCLLVQAIDPSAFRPLGDFRAYAETVAARLTAIPPAPGFEEVLVPGEPEARTRAARSRDGVPIPDRTWDAIGATARELGVAVAL